MKNLPTFNQFINENTKPKGQGMTMQEIIDKCEVGDTLETIGDCFALPNKGKVKAIRLLGDYVITSITKDYIPNHSLIVLKDSNGDLFTTIHKKTAYPGLRLKNK